MTRKSPATPAHPAAKTPSETQSEAAAETPAEAAGEAAAETPGAVPSVEATGSEQFEALAGSEAAYHDFLAAALAIPGTDVQVCRANMALALHNIQQGTGSLTPLVPRLAVELPRFDPRRAEGLADLAQAVAFAQRRVAAQEEAVSQVQELAAEARRMRDLLLTSADAAAKQGHLKASEVAAIRAGSGLTDLANDCTDLAALFRRNAAALQGHTGITEAHLAAADAAGKKLRAVVVPAGALAGAGATRNAARDATVETRDRLWTLLLEGHAWLRKAGYYVWGDDFDAHTPALQARTRKKASAAAKKTAPAASAGTAIKALEIETPPTGAPRSATPSPVKPTA